MGFTTMERPLQGFRVVNRPAQKAAFGKADDDDVVVKTKFVGGIAQVCD